MNQAITGGLATFLFCAGAHAEELTRGNVRIDASSHIVLERVEGDRVTFVCRAPCDKRLDLRGRYRLSGSGIRPSNLLTLEPDSKVVSVSPSSSGSFTSGLILTIIGGAFLVTSASLAGAAAGGGFDTLVPGFFSVLALPVGLGTAIPGVVLLANNVRSNATVTNLPPSATAQKDAKAFIAPIVAVAF